jgi:uncharacterized membrane protein YhaH (DUF805 family)
MSDVPLLISLIVLIIPIALAIVLLIIRRFKSAIVMMLTVPAAVLATPGNEGAVLIFRVVIFIAWIAIALLLIDTIQGKRKWKYLEKERAELSEKD